MRNIPKYLVVRDRVLVGYKKGIPEHVSVPNGVTGIGYGFFGYNAFRGCASLKSVVLPGTVRGICDNAFTDCTSLESVMIPASVKKIGMHAFAGCTSLKEIRFGGTKSQWLAAAELGCNQNLLAVKISCSDGIVKFEHTGGLLMSGSIVYGYLDGLPSAVTIPAPVTGIAKGAFAKCTSLKEVTLPAGITKISALMFCGCTSLERVTIPESVTEIEAGAFHGLHIA